ncbi:MAG: ABC transporter permease, partial [Planctomycetota bacterium]
MGLLLRLAWWQMRGRRQRLLVIAACIAVGIAARVAVGSFAAQVDQALDDQGRELLMADVEITATAALSPTQRADLIELVPAPADRQRVVSMVTMAASAEARRSHIIQLVAVDDDFPHYGAVAMVDAAGAALPVAALNAAAEPVAVVQRDLLPQLGIAIGDAVRLGGESFRVIGTLQSVPGLAFGGFALGSRALIGNRHLAATGLTGRGARARFRHLVRCPDEAAAQALVAALRQRWQIGAAAAGESEELPDGGVRVRAFRDAQQQVGAAFDRLTTFLRLVSLAALALAGIGVVGVVRVHVVDQLDDVATYQVLGARASLLAQVIVAQVVVVAVVGGLAGAALGVAAQGVIAGALQGVTPIALAATVNWAVIAWGVLLAVGMAVVCALVSLARVLDVSPLQVWRAEAPLLPRRAWALGVGTIVTVVVLAVLRVELGQWSWALGALLALTVLALALALI